MIPKPKNQKALVLYSVLTTNDELSSFYWVKKYMIYKWATRVGELEKEFGIMFKRHNKDLIVKTFEVPKKTSYVVYTPILSWEQYLDIYKKVNQ